MAEVKDIRWGAYKSWEGPYFHGSRKYVLPASPTPGQRAFDVITRTEGGAPDAVNMYDRCVVSVGYIQWCEAAYFLTSKLLGHLFEKNPSLAAPMAPALAASGARFAKNAAGRWRFTGPGGEVDELPEQHGLFFLRSSGARGSWDDESRERAKLWAACLSDVLAQQEADALQVDYTVARLRGFATAEAQKVLWGQDAGIPDDGWVGAMRTAFLSFASNLPAVASKHLLIAAGASQAQKWSKDWCVSLLGELTFGPGVTIYPGRYDKIRPYLEKNYGVDLPDFAKELKEWREDLDRECRPEDGEPDFIDPKEIQQLLIDLGHDLGPAGADGRIGPKSRDAIETFQRLSGLTPDGIVGPKTRRAMVEAWRRLRCA